MGEKGGVCSSIPNKVVLEKLPEKVISEPPGNRGDESQGMLGKSI